MTGGILQLAAYGSQNYLLNNNPQLSFFKNVYKPYTNFANESKRIELSRVDALLNTTTLLTCKIPRYGDLMANMFFICQIPDIILKQNGYRFKWVKNFGEMLIDNYYITSSGTILDRQFGEWAHIWRQLTTDTSKLHIYNKMTGNTADMYEPDFVRNEITTQPFIKGRSVVIPLDFWFTKNPGLAIPLISLQYHELYVNIELRALNDLYLIDTLDGRGYRRINDAIRDYVSHVLFTTPNSLVIYPYIEATFVFLDNAERNVFAKSSLDYLIEQHQRFVKEDASGSVMIDLILQNPVKEIVFVLRTNISSQKNEWTNFMGANRVHLIESAKLLFNGQERIEEKPVEYYSFIEPWQYHSGSPPDGVYVISFSLQPEAFQPSGACNMSRVNKVQLHLVLRENYVCDILVYTTNYNFFRVIGGMGGIAFAS